VLMRTGKAEVLVVEPARSPVAQLPQRKARYAPSISGSFTPKGKVCGACNRRPHEGAHSVIHEPTFAGSLI
jgi:hypothetical protein